MVGLGFMEVMNFTLTNERVHYEFMRVKPENPVKLANPVSTEYTIMRQMLLPGLMKNLAENKHESFPQRLFEVSDVAKINTRLETMCERRLHVAACLIPLNGKLHRDEILLRSPPRKSRLRKLADKRG
jgi:phenylalanyl-tRNA synthetase beta chain